MSATQPITRAAGVTAAERYLQQLCERSFLSLWSYSGVHRDQGRVGGKGDGKEVCDLIVVFENHVLLFSDKACDFPNTGNLDVDWSRWYRKAIKQSADQIRGAERWIKDFPNCLFLDPACTQPFPIDLPNPATAKFHRIVVAHGVAERCRKEFGGGSGSLIIAPGIEGDAHCVSAANGGMPFAIGQVDPTKGFVHVLDDASLAVVMRELDTITDFVAYLIKKENLIHDNRLVTAAGEDDLLAYYLGHLNADGEHDFVLPRNFNGIVIEEGYWQEFEHSPERMARIAADDISYMWDALIESFSGHMFAGTQYHATPNPGPRDGEKILRYLAREPRTRRRMLAGSLYEVVARTPTGDVRHLRVVPPSRRGDPYYAFLILAQPSYAPSYEEYRAVRGQLLYECCRTVKLHYPEAENIVGVATEPLWCEERSEDVVYFDARTFTAEDRKDAQRVANELGLLKKTQRFSSRVREYPVPLSPNPLAPL
jgi:hypothetical protein